MKQLTVEQAADNLGDLIDAAVGGEEVILVHGASSAVRLMPLRAEEGKPQFGSAKGMFTMSEDFDAPLDDFREHME
jgi:antitoxin (DNA-binding transcriptional repressor) of toxin-antitoxin stability system